MCSGALLPCHSKHNGPQSKLFPRVSPTLQLTPTEAVQSCQGFQTWHCTSHTGKGPGGGGEIGGSGRLPGPPGMLPGTGEPRSGRSGYPPGLGIGFGSGFLGQVLGPLGAGASGVGVWRGWMSGPGSGMEMERVAGNKLRCGGAVVTGLYVLVERRRSAVCGKDTVTFAERLCPAGLTPTL